MRRPDCGELCGKGIRIFHKNVTAWGRSLIPGCFLLILYIHAEYSGEEIVIALDGTVLEGEKDFPKNKLKLLEAWMEIHRDDLNANWKLLSGGEQFFRIDPLK